MTVSMSPVMVMVSSISAGTFEAVVIEGTRVLSADVVALETAAGAAIVKLLFQPAGPTAIRELVDTGRVSSVTVCITVR